MKETQTWEDATLEMILMYPKTDRRYTIDLSQQIQVDKENGRSYIPLADGTQLCLWNQQKSAVAKLITKDDAKDKCIEIAFRREEATNRLYPVRVARL